MSKHSQLNNDRHLSASDLIEQVGFTPYQGIVIALCMMVNMLDGFDITAMAVVAAEVGRELQISDEKLGFVFSFSLAGMMLGVMFLAPFSDVFGRRKVILASLLTVGISVLLTAFAESIISMLSLRFISGLGAGAMLASQATLASEYSNMKFRSLAVAIVTAGYPLGAMFTGIIAQFLVPQFGWQGMFYIRRYCNIWVMVFSIRPTSRISTISIEK